MRVIRVLAAAGFGAVLLGSTGAMAQVQLGICGPPPLPPCARPVPPPEAPPPEMPPRYDRRGERDFSRLCITRTMRCRTDEPRPIGARCTCENEDGEEVLGRIR
jgi:hypothetical protein